MFFEIEGKKIYLYAWLTKQLKAYSVGDHSFIREYCSVLATQCTLSEGLAIIDYLNLLERAKHVAEVHFSVIKGEPYPRGFSHRYITVEFPKEVTAKQNKIFNLSKATPAKLEVCKNFIISTLIESNEETY